MNTMTFNSNRFPVSSIVDHFFDEYKKSYDLSSCYWTKNKKGDSVLILAIPGLNKNNAKITLKSDILTIEGTIDTEYYKKNIKKQYLLPEGTDYEKISVSVKDGIATITAPNLEETNPRQIDIK